MRKGQDIIILAFSKFAKLHPDAILVTAWHNPWASYVNTITSFGLVNEAPDIVNGELALEPWLLQYGIDDTNSFHLGNSPQRRIKKIMQASDVAVFTNRAEGGTNLVAMEAMSAALPVIISNNTGHEDILRDDAAPPHCFPLPRKKPGGGTGFGEPYEDWGDTDENHVVQALEWIYNNREVAKNTGKAARAFIKKHYTWDKAINSIVSKLR